MMTMKNATPTVSLFVRLPVPLRARIDAELKARNQEWATRTDLGKMITQTLDEAFPEVPELEAKPHKSRAVRGGQMRLPLHGARKRSTTKHAKKGRRK